MSSSSDYDPDKSMVTDVSLHPPIHGEGPDAGAPTPASMLLDTTAYIDERSNATTAWSRTSEGYSISVTFWPVHPPRVSCFTVFCSDLKPSDFPMEPWIVAAEDDLVLLSVNIRSLCHADYFVYQAGGCMPSSLKLIKHPSSRMVIWGHVGLLRCRAPKLDDGFYIVASLCFTSVPGHYDLYIYDSRTDEWSTRTALLHQELGQHQYFCFTPDKVITVGGKAGTMGWVDLGRGILFCDVLCQDHTVPLCYVPLPPALLNDDEDEDETLLEGGARPVRDIAVFKGRIEYIELLHQMHFRVVEGDYIPDDWTAATWSRKATDAKSMEEEGSWQTGSKVRASQISAKKKKPVQFELLSKLVDDQGMPLPTLERLHTGHPTLSLHQGNVAYFMTKVNYIEGTKAWVLAIDVKKKTLQGVAEIDARRILGMNFSFTSSSVSEHLQIMAPATLMWQPYLKKQAGVMDCEHKHQDSDVEGTSVRALDQDNMDLE